MDGLGVMRSRKGIARSRTGDRCCRIRASREGGAPTSGSRPLHRGLREMRDGPEVFAGPRRRRVGARCPVMERDLLRPGSEMKRFFDALASLRLALAVMAALAVACILATFYESSAGTAAAQQEFYGTGWFASLLAMLGVNVLASMLKRYPWKAHHAGFVIAHVGILSLLAGSLISVHFGMNASLALYEGETGDHLALAGEGEEEAPLPFRVTLLKFVSEKYPGSSLAASYESWVHVEDPERGPSEHLISMNHPLHYRGYVFFQASFVDGEPMMSILSVTRAPGLPLVYLGAALISAGVAWMFYLKPFLAHRRGERALAARRPRAVALPAS